MMISALPKQLNRKTQAQLRSVHFFRLPSLPASKSAQPASKALELKATIGEQEFLRPQPPHRATRQK